MKNKKVKIAYLLMTFIFLFTYVGGFFLASESYADDNTYLALESFNKPKSGSFKSPSKSHSSPKTTIKPDSGGFSTKPNKSNKNPGSSSTIKPDSGNFSTKPKDNSTNNNKNYDDYQGSSSKRSIFSGRYYGGYSPYRRAFFGYGISSWIIKFVMIIAVLVVLYIIFDYIRSKRN